MAYAARIKNVAPTILISENDSVEEVAIDPRRTAHRQPGLDILRALAIIFVVVYHAGLLGFPLPFRIDRFGWIGVDLFFVLSGYLIAGQLFAPLAIDKSLPIARFYGRRALRILPAYFVILAVYIFLPSLREYQPMRPAWQFLTFTQNFGLRGGTAFSHAWSLCVEFQFYLLLPLLILALRWLSPKRVPPSTLSIFFVIVACAPLLWCLIIRAVLEAQNLRSSPPSFGWWQQWIHYPTYSRLDGLTIGVGLAAIEVFRREWWQALMKSATWIWLPGLAAIIWALALAEDGLGMMSSVLGFFLIALGMGVFLICAVSPRLLLSRKAIPGAAFLATIAYSVYLTHKLVINWVDEMLDAHSIATLPAYAIMVAATLVVGSALFFAIERPFLRLRQRVTPKEEVMK